MCVLHPYGLETPLSVAIYKPYWMFVIRYSRSDHLHNDSVINITEKRYNKNYVIASPAADTVGVGK